MSTRLPEIEQRIREAWPTDTGTLDVLRVVIAIDDEVKHYITIPLVAQQLDISRGLPASAHAGDREMLLHVYRAIQKLASELVGLLDQHFQLLREDGDLDELDDRAVINAIKTGELNDPVTGAPLDDWEQNVIPYYSATALLEELHRERD